MPPNFLRSVPLLLALSFAPAVAPAAESPGQGENAADAVTEATLPARVREIAGSTALSRDAQGKAISELVQAVIVTAIEGVTEENKILVIAVRVASSAVAAAPQFAQVVTTAALDVPAVAQIQGAGARIAGAVREAVAAARPANPEFGGDTADTVVSPSR